MSIRRLLGVAAVAVLAAQVDAAAAQPRRDSAPPAEVTGADRDEVPGRDWRTSGDLAWTAVGSADGFHLLTARSEHGYRWDAVATLAEPGFDTDRWVGNACVTESAEKAVVVYAPRGFTNKADLFDRGGFTAVVDLATGQVTKLPTRASLASFNPGCGNGERAVLTQLGGEDLGKTRLVSVDAAAGRTTDAVELPGDVTSAVPTVHGIVAAQGARLVRIDPGGARTPIADTANVPFDVTVDGSGAIGFLDHAGDRARAVRVDGAGVRTLADGRLGEVGLARGTGGKVFLLGTPQRVEALPEAVTRLAAPANAQPTTTGRLALTEVNEADGSIEITARSPATSRDVQFTAATDTPTTVPPPAGAPRSGSRAADDPHNPVDVDHSCAVRRNEPGTQVYQPTPRQVEWAVDEAVNGGLGFTRPANWKQNGLPAYSPRDWFGPRPLAGAAAGAKVPPQVLLGILSQESNLWQASRSVPEGAGGNPLIGNYYGMDGSTLSDEGAWKIDFSKADCGYGVGQVTDGMRRHGHEKPGTTPTRSVDEQRAVALDYTVNILASLRILSDKWDELHRPGAAITLGNDDPAKLESWFYAIWAYNSGFHPYQGEGKPWGLGWLNNPANPRYPADRTPFLHNSPADAARPQLWPYPEKVLGFAGNSISKASGAGFKPAWWNNDAHKSAVKPPNTQFCTADNNCRPGALIQPDEPGLEKEKPGPCANKNAAGQYDLKCWVHTSNPWKQDCALTCGVGWERFDPGRYPEQPDGAGFPPVCEMPVALDGAWVIDDVPDSFRTLRPGCEERRWRPGGTFRFDFGSSPEAGSLSKVDTGQVSAGFGGHFWFGHTRKDADTRGGALKTTGTWTLEQRYTGWARVLVHMPDLGAHTQQAAYTVDLGNGVRKTRSLLQRTEQNKWVQLGAFHFDGVPSVSLSNITRDGDTVEDVAWDAIAIEPLGNRKPDHFIVSLGDSFASGEGSGLEFGERFFTETDNNGGNSHRNACHRSKESWARSGTLANNWTIGKHVDDYDSSVDFHFVACSGARAHNLLPSPKPGQPNPPEDAKGRTGGPGPYRELPQVDSGFLDENTTLVTLSIGGNDAEFTTVLTQCIKPGVPCQDSALDMDEGVPLRDAEPRRIQQETGPSVRTVLTEIHKAAPNAKILLMGYPTLFAPGSDCGDLAITGEEVPWLNDMAGLMTTTLKGVVADAAGAGVPVTYAEPANFAGHELCGNGDKAFNPIIIKKTAGDDPKAPVSAQSFHPNRLGADLFAAVYSAELRKMGM